ncbi:MAG: LPPG--FO 2-phospho-L-lactate transferase [Porticoccaceae bacterium]|nr:MAG: LPPG--FO 2-phospho-L-lactate transferase [Porticoccaceae bacterium]
MTGQILALSGGVGGAKLVWGLARVVAPERLAVVCNTGDDFVHLGLPICPDLDTVLYTLAGCADPERGWGVAGESWRVLERLGALGGPTWFRLGDLDLATHLRRAELLASGATLSEATAALARALGVAVAVLPMSDDPVATLVDTDEGTLPFQHYFVARRCEPRVGGFRFAGIDAARPQPRFLALLEDPTLAAVILCPSNPFVSLDPILALPGVRARLAACPAPVVAVSPIVGGRALKGPAAKMLAELGLPVWTAWRWPAATRISSTASSWIARTPTGPRRSRASASPRWWRPR